jgi:hypothetical protein
MLTPVYVILIVIIPHYLIRLKPFGRASTITKIFNNEKINGAVAQTFITEQPCVVPHSHGYFLASSPHDEQQLEPPAAHDDDSEHSQGQAIHYDL